MIKKRTTGAESLSEVSVDEQHYTENRANNFMSQNQRSRSVSGSKNQTRPGPVRKHKGADFTPLKEKIDDAFFDD